MADRQYNVHFSNGEVAGPFESYELAENRVLQELSGDQAPPDLGAEVWEIGPNDIGTGRLVGRFKSTDFG